MPYHARDNLLQQGGNKFEGIRETGDKVSSPPSRSLTPKSPSGTRGGEGGRFAAQYPGYDDGLDCLRVPGDPGAAVIVGPPPPPRSRISQDPRSGTVYKSIQIPFEEEHIA